MSRWLIWVLCAGSGEHANEPSTGAGRHQGLAARALIIRFSLCREDPYQNRISRPGAFLGPRARPSYSWHFCWHSQPPEGKRAPGRIPISGRAGRAPAAGAGSVWVALWGWNSSTGPELQTEPEGSPKALHLLETVGPVNHPHLEGGADMADVTVLPPSLEEAGRRHRPRTLRD